MTSRHCQQIRHLGSWPPGDRYVSARERKAHPVQREIPSPACPQGGGDGGLWVPGAHSSHLCAGEAQGYAKGTATKSQDRSCFLICKMGVNSRIYLPGLLWGSNELPLSTEPQAWHQQLMNSWYRYSCYNRARLELQTPRRLWGERDTSGIWRIFFLFFN